MSIKVKLVKTEVEEMKPKIGEIATLIGIEDSEFFKVMFDDGAEMICEEKEIEILPENPSNPRIINFDEDKNQEEKIEEKEEKLNLLVLLKYFVGEKFWSPIWGVITYLGESYGNRGGNRPMAQFKDYLGQVYNVAPTGYLRYELEKCPGAEIIVYPSQDQRDWKLWKKEEGGKRSIEVGDIVNVRMKPVDRQIQRGTITEKIIVEDEVIYKVQFEVTIEENDILGKENYN